MAPSPPSADAAAVEKAAAVAPTMALAMTAGARFDGGLCARCRPSGRRCRDTYQPFVRRRLRNSLSPTPVSKPAGDT
jgi:hypothetical protein